MANRLNGYKVAVLAVDGFDAVVLLSTTATILSVRFARKRSTRTAAKE